MEIRVVEGQEQITEGQPAQFYLRLWWAEIAEGDIEVAVDISQQGDFGAAVGRRTVIIPDGSSQAGFTVPTVDDDHHEADGSVTARLAWGDGTGFGTDYDISLLWHFTGTVMVADNDVAPG